MLNSFFFICSLTRGIVTTGGSSSSWAGNKNPSALPDSDSGFRISRHASQPTCKRNELFTFTCVMSQNKKQKTGDLDASQGSQQSHAVTRAASEKGDKYDAAQREIKKLQANLNQKIAQAQALKETIGSVADDVVAQVPTWKHAEACLRYMKANDSCTQVKVCELMQKGQLPGDFFGVKVTICQRYLSTYKGKLESGSNICSKGGRPILLDDFETQFIGNLIKHQQIRNKSILHIQVAMLIRTLKLIKHGYASVDEMDRSITKNWIGNKRKRVVSGDNGNAPEIAQDQSDGDDDVESGDETEDDEVGADHNAAKQKAFDNLKSILGESLGKYLMLPKSYRWPSKLTVRRLCIKNDWTVRKAQMQTAHRFDGASPDMIDGFFESTLRAYINFDINSPDQRHNCDEKRTGAEFEQSGRCVKVMCIKRPASLDVAGSQRISGTKSCATRQIHGVTQIPYPCANGKTSLMVYIRKRLSKNESAAKSRQAEQEILDEVKEAYREAGIAVACFTTDTGWMNGETFKKCTCLFIRELLKEQNVFIQFSDERAPTMKELPRLNRNHMLFLDNASCHDTSCDLFRLETLLRGLVLMPTPPNTTNITQACDQHINKLYTMWLRQSFTAAIEFDIANHNAPNFNPLLLTVWAAQINSNAATLNIPQDMVIDLRADFRGDQIMQAHITRLNSVLETAASSQRAGGKFTSARVARITVGPWIAALKYAEASFVTVGLADPPISNSVTLRSGPTAEAQQEKERQFRRYSLYPDKVKKTPIAIAAAEVHANRVNNMARNKAEICQKAAALLNLVPALGNQIAVQTGDIEHELAKSTAQLLWGADASEGSFSLASSVLQAADLIVAQSKSQSSLSNYLATTPPPSIVPLQALVEEQQSELQQSNLNWLTEKSEKLHNKCEAAKKAAGIVSASLTKKLQKRDELMTIYANHCDGLTVLSAAALTKVETAASALEITMRKERDGSEVAPKKKNLDSRMHDVEEMRNKIAAAKKKLEEKCGERLVTKSAVLEALRSHASDFETVDEQLHNMRNIVRNFKAAIDADEQE